MDKVEFGLSSLDHYSFRLLVTTADCEVESGILSEIEEEGSG